MGAIDGERMGPMSDYMQLPEDLPVPVDDGKADHLRGMTLPSVVLAATGKRSTSVTSVRASRSSTSTR
jgi:hypothetical protein